MGSSKDVLDNNIYRFDIEQGIWTDVSVSGENVKGRAYAGCVLIDNRLYVSG